MRSETINLIAESASYQFRLDWGETKINELLLGLHLLSEIYVQVHECPKAVGRTVGRSWNQFQQKCDSTY